MSEPAPVLLEFSLFERLRAAADAARTQPHVLANALLDAALTNRGFPYEPPLTPNDLYDLR